MSGLKNELSWSPSRGKILQKCARAYYYRHYGSWNGWERDGTPEQRLAYRLKQMKSLHSWIGDVVHRVIEESLRAARAKRAMPKAEDLQERARFLLNQEWFESKDKAWLENPKHYCNLFDHYYSREVSRDFLDRLRTKVFRSLANFCGSAVLREIMEARDWIGMEKLCVFTHNGNTCFVKPDFAIRPNPSDVVVYDWKTGRPRPEDDFQVACYAMLAKRKWNAKQPEVVLFYLPSNQVIRRRPDVAELASVEQCIDRDFETMRAPLRDQDKNEAVKEDFPLCRQPTECEKCEFFELCEVELKEEEGGVPL